jgi:hypothetical protein
MSTLLLLALVPALAAAQDSVIVTDASIVGNVTWSADTIYVLDHFVFVEDGESLTIPAGTVVKGHPGQAENASALIVARGGKIFANGTAQDPIIFTSSSDDVNNLNDLPLNSRGLWGGVIILGKATINVAGGEENIEGIPTTEPRGLYGGTDDDDTSGVFRYVSIRYGGSIIGAANEINSLTMGGVGRGTVIEYVESYNNADDGYEWFGGTVDTRYLVSAFNDDDGFDYDEGWRGRNQFWFLVQDSLEGNTGGEHDGGTVPEDGLPYAIPQVHNATYIGAGETGINVGNDFALNIRDNAGGRYRNSIFTDFYGYTVQIEDLVSGKDSRERLDSADIVLADNMWYGFGLATPDDSVPQAFVRAYMTAPAQNNRFMDPQLRGISRKNDGGLDPRPQTGSPALTGAATVPGDGFFTQTSYVGAFGPGPGDNWAKGWTFIDELGFFACAILNTGDVNVSGTITSADVITLVNYVFKGGADPLPCAASGDVNCSGTVTSADIIYLVGFVFKGGPAPCDVCTMIPGTWSCP